MPDAERLDAPKVSSYELIVTVGLAAAQMIERRQGSLASARPTLCLLIPRQSFERLPSAAGAVRARRLSAVFIDQPIARQLDLVRVALPDKDRVGVVFGPTSAAVDKELRDGARERGLVVRSATASDGTQVYAALQDVLQSSDLLLALADPVAFSAATAYAVLLASYHAQVPVVGFSQAMVDAGALIGMFSTPRQQGRQGAEIVAAFLSGAALPAPQFPRYFTVATNVSVARSLGVRLDTAATLTTAVTAASRSPAADPANPDAPRRTP